VTEQDPGTGGPKLSKSGDATDMLDRRNKSYNKVLDLQFKWHKARWEGLFDEIPNALFRWKQKAEWHEKEFGW
jgi:hypothetical protein